MDKDRPPYKAVSVGNLRTVGETTNVQREKVSHTKDQGPESLQMSQKSRRVPPHF